MVIPVVREWYWQRLSAIILAFLLPASYFLILCLRAKGMTQLQFLDFLHQTPIQIWHSFMLLAFGIHLSIGIKIILEDYVSISLRIPLLACLMLLIISLLFWGMKMIWWVAL